MKAFLPMHNPLQNNVDDASLAEKVCLPFLRKTQNSDGGWGFTAGAQSRVESTAWALLALHEFRPSTELDEAFLRGLRLLHSTQLPDGSWPAAAGQQQGSWVTALACWTLLALREKSQQDLVRGLRWLIDERPGNSRWWWRILRRLTVDKNVSAQNDSYFGWSWTSGTASWVEPTSYALLVLRRVPALMNAKIGRRLRLAEAMLYDRMCPGGGWNCGNPMVYGVPGEAQIGPTVWALLALREDSERPEIQESLNWLENHWHGVSSPGSLALAEIGLISYGRETSSIRSALRDSYASDALFWSIPVVAWSAFAMSGTQKWLTIPGRDLRA